MRQKPQLSLVKIADGAGDNAWSYLSQELPAGAEVIDDYHAADHLKKAFDHAYGENSTKSKENPKKVQRKSKESPKKVQRKSKEKIFTYPHVLKEEPHGVEHVIKALAYQRKKHLRPSTLKTAREYCRKNRQRMRYAKHLSNQFPIGSGVTEAACKTLVTQRMKSSGMRWRNPDGQGVLTLRS